ncbi:hypothetical protein BFS06_10360 [Clostridium perfringens]|uniref:glycosyltransferase family 4 protein n=1 Tax=Clostridium perfringens TaxID=1502 RepID=UPI00103A3A10|nr:glycosyltransferase family 4 protein [Clostridium perfringens]MDM0469394.1 glycosyltransferase family 4 protein [Clostridium perfringens]MDM0626629.1 glycosyltransferase family 4 protein [Clostridium perfringens]TBX15207.1 hypothetical protein BFS06_10360 [Clostridium perfringens]
MIYIITNSYPEKKIMFSTNEFEYILSKDNNIKILSFSKYKNLNNAVIKLSLIDGIKEFLNPRNKEKSRKKYYKFLFNYVFDKNFIQFGKNIYSYLLALSIIHNISLKNSDIIFSYWLTRSSIIAYYLKKLNGNEYICQGHGSDIYIYPPNNIEEILSESKRVITVGNKNKYYISEKFKIDEEKIEVFRLGVSSKFIEYLEKNNRNSTEGVINFITVGRYVRVKGIDILLEAIYKLHLNKKLNEFIKFTIVGDGEEYHMYKKYIKDKNIDKYVDLRGWASREELAELLSNSDIYILPSRSEGLPVALMEACAAKMPIIATNVGSVNEVAIDNYNAILIKKDNCDDLYNAILKFLSFDKNKINEMSLNSYKIYNKKYRLEKNISEKYNFLKFN